MPLNSELASSLGYPLPPVEALFGFFLNESCSDKFGYVFLTNALGRFPKNRGQCRIGCREPPAPRAVAIGGEVVLPPAKEAKQEFGVRRELPTLEHPVWDSIERIIRLIHYRYEGYQCISVLRLFA